MEIEFKNTKKDYIDSFKLFLKERFRKWNISAIILLFCILFYDSTAHYGWLGYAISLVSFLAFIATFGYLMPLSVFVVKFNKLVSKEDAYLLKRKLSITDEGLRTESEKHNLLRNWESIISVRSNSKFIYIYLADKKNILLTKRCFSSDVEIANFIGLINSKINQAKNQSNNTEQRYSNNPSTYSFKPKPNYWLGFFGFIPLIGAFFGLAFIINGIFKYKDKWLVLIGIGGILFTVFIYSSMKPNSKLVNQGFAKIDTMQLNSLVKEIEFYKMQNGTYPDSLKQLNTKDSFTGTSDPLLSGKKNDKYNYQKIGNKYTLFSSGIDQIPNTKDDIYPSIDTSRTGLIIKPR